MDKRLRIQIAGIVIGLVVAYPAAWIGGTFASAKAGAGPSAVSALLDAPFAMLNPFALPLNNGTLTGAAFGLIACLLVAVQISSNSGKFDYGREYGDARWASAHEMARLADKRSPWNNICYAQGCELAIAPKTDAHRKQAGSSWLNTCVIGSTGAGKLWRYIAPLIMQLVGTRLAYIPWRTNKEVDPFEWAHAPKEDQCADMFVVDTKGETLEAFGPLLMRAGYDVRVFDGVSFDKDGFNPFAQIQTYSTDVTCVEEQSMRVSVDFGDGRRANALVPLGADALKSEGAEAGHIVRLQADDGGTLAVEVRAQVITREVSPLEDGTEAANAADIELKRAELKELKASLDGEYTDESGQRKVENRVSQTIEQQRFTRSFVVVSVVAKNQEARPANVRVRLELDGVFTPMVKSERSTTGQVIDECRTMTGTGAQRCDLDFVLFPCEEGMVYQMAACAVVAHMRQMRIPDALDLARTADTLVRNLAEPDKPKGDIFWENAERLYLMQLIGYVFERYSDPARRNFDTLMTYLDLSKVDFTGTNVSPIDVAFEEWRTGLTYVEEAGETYGPRVQKPRAQWAPLDHGPHPQDTSIAVHCYRAFKQGAPETLQSILISCSTSLMSVFPKKVREATRADEIGIGRLGDPGRPKAIFAIVDDQDHTFDFIFALMISQAMTVNIRKADVSYAGKLPRQVHLILDELANIATITNLERIVAVVRSRNMVMHFILQSLNQLTTRYGNHAQTIRDNCAQLMFLGGQSEETLKGLEELSGQETIEEVTSSRANQMMGTTNLQRGRHGRALVTVDQLRRLPEDECVVMINHQRPYKGKKVDPQRHPLYPYVYSDYPRQRGAPDARTTAPFDYQECKQSRGRRDEAA